MTEKFNGKMLAQLQARFARSPEAISSVIDRKLSEGGKVDRRTLKRTGRTELFQARVTKATRASLHNLAKEKDITLGELLDQAVALLQAW